MTDVESYAAAVERAALIMGSGRDAKLLRALAAALRAGNRLRLTLATDGTINISNPAELKLIVGTKHTFIELPEQPKD